MLCVDQYTCIEALFPAVNFCFRVCKYSSRITNSVSPFNLFVTSVYLRPIEIFFMKPFDNFYKNTQIKTNKRNGLEPPLQRSLSNNVCKSVANNNCLWSSMSCKNYFHNLSYLDKTRHYLKWFC